MFICTGLLSINKFCLTGRFSLIVTGFHQSQVVLSIPEPHSTLWRRNKNSNAMEKKYKLSTVQKMKFSLRISSVFVWCSIKTYKIPTKLYTKESAYFRQCFFSLYSLLIPLKILENQSFSNVFLMFSGGSKGNIGKKRVKNFIVSKTLFYRVFC